MTSRYLLWRLAQVVPSVAVARSSRVRRRRAGARRDRYSDTAPLCGPRALPAAQVVISINVAGMILLEAGLGFIGLRDPSRMSWAYLANNAQRFLPVAWWIALFPSAAIALASSD